MYINTFSGLEQVSVNQGNRNSPEYIRWLQTSLNSTLGLNLKVDGIMGAHTRSAIRSFQQQQGLVADGIVGPRTAAALIKATSGAGGPVIKAPAATKKAPDATLIQFDKDSAKLKDFHATEIDSVADKIVASRKTAQPIFTVYVKGHTSSEGSAQYNVGLGYRRALAVRKALQNALERKEKHLSYKVLILAQSKGESEPIDTNETEAGRSRNRRVEILLSTKALQPLPPPKKKKDEEPEPPQPKSSSCGGGSECDPRGSEAYNFPICRGWPCKQIPGLPSHCGICEHHIPGQKECRADAITKRTEGINKCLDEFKKATIGCVYAAARCAATLGVDRKACIKAALCTKEHSNLDRCRQRAWGEYNERVQKCREIGP